MMMRNRWALFLIFTSLGLAGLDCVGAGEVPSPEEVKKLVAQLGHNDFEVRYRAQKELEPSVKELKKQLEKIARSHKDTEIRWRVEEILSLIPPPVPKRTSPFNRHRPVKKNLNKEQKAAKKARDQLNKARSALYKAFSRIEVKFDKKAPKMPEKIEIKFQNLYADKLELEMDWDLENSPWKLEPASQKITLAKKEKKVFSWTVVCSGSLKEPRTLGPLPKASVKATIGDKGLAQNIRSYFYIKDFNKLLGKGAPVVDVKKTEKPIVIDGKLDESIWKQKENFSKWYIGNLLELPDVKTKAWVCYDATHLYFAVKAVEPDMDGVLVGAEKRDDAVWEDDSIELFLDTRFDRRNYYQIGINTKGVFADSGTSGRKWNGDIKVKTSTSKEGWQMECAISWKSMRMKGPPVKGKAIGFNIQRNRTVGKYQCMQWAPTLGSSHQPKLYGKLKFK